LGVEIDADQVYKLKKELKNTPLKYTTTKNKNKYGQDYDHDPPNLTKYRSRTTKKRGYDPQKHYTKTEAAAFHDKDDYNKVWDEFSGLKVEDQYKRELGKRRKTKEDIDKTVKHATNMLDWLDNKSGIDKSSDDYIKLRAALERNIKHPKRTKANYDYEGMASLIDLSVNKNKILHSILSSQPATLLCFRHKNLLENQTLSGTDIMSLKSIPTVSLKQHQVINNLEMDNGVNMEWNAISRGLVSDPRLNSFFRKSAHGKKLAMWLKLSNEEKAAWKYDIDAWADD
jgi:hypothetical protein